MNISRSLRGLNDLEDAGCGGRLNDPLLSKKSEESEAQTLRWKFIRKVYTIVSLQMLLTIAVSAAVVFATPVSRFAFSPAGITLFVFLIFLIVMGNEMTNRRREEVKKKLYDFRIVSHISIDFISLYNVYICVTEQRKLQSVMETIVQVTIEYKLVPATEVQLHL